MKNNQMICFSDLIHDCFNKYEVYIPLIQRNYKWDADDAAKLATDLWKAFLEEQDTYTVGMITLYRESDTKMQLIDGQQRIITLYMLLRYLNPNKEYYSFGFERDEAFIKDGVVIHPNHMRQNYLKNISSPTLEEKDMYTDLIRFRKNYNEIKEQLTNTKVNKIDTFDTYIPYNPIYAEKFIEYIRKNVYFLLHVSKEEPFDEFINLNKNKTRFVISDRIKANLIIDSVGERKKEVLSIFKELSEVLFHSKDIWDLVKQGYCEQTIPKDNKRRKNKHYPDENRLKLICCERYGSNNFDVNSTLGYQYDRELTLLKQYRDIFNVLLSDIDQNDWKSYNGFNCLYKSKELIGHKKEAFRFFIMLKSNDYTYFEKYLLNEYVKMKETPFRQACFIESQLENEKSKLEYIDNLKSIYKEFNKNQDNWLYNGEDEFKVFIHIYESYIKDKYDK